MASVRSVAVLCDIHGNLPALDAVLAELAADPPDAVVIGGDVVAGPFPAEVQQEVVFTAAVAAETREAEAARALIAFLRTTEIAALIQASGMNPG